MYVSQGRVVNSAVDSRALPPDDSTLAAAVKVALSGERRLASKQAMVCATAIGKSVSGALGARLKFQHHHVEKLEGELPLPSHLPSICFVQLLRRSCKPEIADSYQQTRGAWQAVKPASKTGKGFDTPQHIPHKWKMIAGGVRQELESWDWPEIAPRRDAKAVTRSDSAWLASERKCHILSLMIQSVEYSISQSASQRTK